MDLKFPLSIDSDGRVETVDGVDETQQRAYLRLSSRQGEWAFDLSYGVPWLEIRAQHPPDLGAARALILQQLLRVPGLDKVESLSLSLDRATRHMTVTGRVVCSGVSIGISV